MSDWKAFDEWFAGQHLAMLDLGGLEGGVAYKKFLTSFAGVPRRFTGQMRMQAFVRLRYEYPMGGNGYTCVVLSATSRNAEVIFGLCYIRSGKGDVEYVCASPTFESMDGEYRHRFIQYAAFQKAYDALEKELSEFEKHLLEMIASDKLAIEATIYPPQAAEGVAATIEKGRLGIRMLAVSMMLDSQSTIQGHTIPSYGALIRDIEAGWPEMRPAAKAIHKNKTSHMFINGAQGALRVECGQKLTPLMSKEVSSPHDINFGAWRELYARQLASNLVINGVAPSLHLDNQWVYIEGADAGLFENTAMERKYRRGQTSKLSIESLRTARGIIAPEVPQSYAASSFDAHIYDAVEVAQSYLLTSNIAMCATMEHTRDTIASAPMLVARTEFPEPALLLLCGDVKYMEKFAFDVLYGAHCLHTKAHLIQADLHGNNFTLNRVVEVFRHVAAADGTFTFEPAIQDPIMAYVAGPRGEADTFVFPYTGLVGTIIDFSRAIFGPGMQPALAEEFGQDFTRNFYRDQVTRAIRALHRYAPAFVEKNQEAVKALFLADFDTAFRVLSYIDFIAVGGSIARIFSEYKAQDSDRRQFRPAKECIEFAQLVEKKSRERLVVALHDALEKKRTGKIPFAGEVMFEVLFAKWKYSPAREDIKKSTLCDVYNYNAPLKWDGRDYETFPPWSRLDRIEEQLGGIKIAEVLGRSEQPFLDALIPSPQVDIIAETLRAEQEALDRPAAATSSWIE